MKLVIEIEQEWYERACKATMSLDGALPIYQSIKEGTPYKERPHGEWLNEDYGIGECYAECSECGESTDGEAKDNGFGYDYSFPNFCPNCGALMVKEGGKE